MLCLLNYLDYDNYKLRISNYELVKDNIIQTKSFEFALKIIKLFNYLNQEKHEYILSKQLLRSGTSIGANVEEAIGGQSRNDFISKLSVAYKEARESQYWLKLLYSSGYIPSFQVEILQRDIDEMLRIIGRIQKTMKVNS